MHNTKKALEIRYFWVVSTKNRHNLMILIVETHEKCTDDQTASKSKDSRDEKRCSKKTVVAKRRSNISSSCRSSSASKWKINIHRKYLMKINQQDQMKISERNTENQKKKVSAQICFCNTKRSSQFVEQRAFGRFANDDEIDDERNHVDGGQHGLR